MWVRVPPCPPLRKVFEKSSEGCGWVDNGIVWSVFCPDSPIGRGMWLRTTVVRVRISLGAQIQRTESRKTYDLCLAEIVTDLTKQRTERLLLYKFS